MLIHPDALPIEQYHAAAPAWLSKTTLRNYEKKGAAWFKLAHLDKVLEAETPGGAEEGLALDCYLTEGSEVFAKRYAIKPNGMNFANLEGKAWKAAHAGKEILPYDDHLILLDAIAAVRALPQWPEIEKALRQHTIRKLEPALGIGLQSRPDFVAPETGMYWDLKKTRELARFGNQAIELDYHLQAAIAGHCLAGDGIALNKAHLIAMEWERGARACVYEIPHEVLVKADEDMRRIAAEIADRMRRDDWLNYAPTTPPMLEIPDWRMRKMGVA